MTMLLPIGAQNKEWDAPFPPHRIADNLYYVGSKGLATYLITTSAGNILINASFERTVPLIRANVEKLGFKFADVKCTRLSVVLALGLTVAALAAHMAEADMVLLNT